MFFLESHAMLTTLDHFATRPMTYIKLKAVIIKHVVGVTNVVSQLQCHIIDENIAKYILFEGLDRGINYSRQAF